MRLLVSHVNYPSQFRRLVPSWVRQGHEVIFLARQIEWHAYQPKGFRLIQYKRSRQSSGAALHPYIRRFESALIEGQSTCRAAFELSDQGWQPDCIISHVGFGNGLYLREVFPQARRIGLVEWFYNSKNSDVDFLPPHKVDSDHQLRLRTWNAETLLEISALDQVVVPTQWQRQQFPEILRSHLKVIHEGVDTDCLNHLRTSGIKRPSCLPDDSGIEVLTYVSRCFEEYRGFPQAIEAILRIQQQRPNLHVLLVGHDGTAYGNGRSDGRGWAEWARESLPLDPCRTHWLGSLQENDYHQVLACSDVHLYLTVPFVLSWSLLEAMAAGCALVASATPPVQEVLEHGRTALLVDFFDMDSQVQAIHRLLEDKNLSRNLGAAAQNTASAYSMKTAQMSWDGLLTGWTVDEMDTNLHSPVG